MLETISSHSDQESRTIWDGTEVYAEISQAIAVWQGGLS